MNINFFKNDSLLYPFRWFIVFAVCIAGLMAYADLTGRRIMSFSDNKQWNSGGPGSHK